ncbi:MAG: ATP-binding protein [Deltaproteobacteria bacterium]|jgi:anti-sigma regulatory factor (Ser/Thr protein kinase)|nr:ATP-binding protein [Deltaproteobacteria bacterium]
MKSLLLTAGLDRLDEVRSFLTKDFPDELAALTPSVELILEEFLVNVVTHAYKGSPGPLEVNIRQVTFDDWPHLVLEVVDWGPPFDPFSEATPPELTQDIDDKPIGGLGIHLIRNIAAHHSYCRDRGANSVEVWVRCP